MEMQRFHEIQGLLEVVSGLFVFVVLLEAFLDWRARRRDLLETGTNLFIAVGQELLGKVFGLTIALAALCAVATVTPFALPVDGWTWAAGFVLADFFYYWTHRLEHRSRLFWAHHSVHHSSRSFDLSTAGRISCVESFIGWYGLVPMVLLGFHPLQVLIFQSVGLLYQTWIHTQKISRLGWLEGVLNTPSAHRVHHGADTRYLDSNYGAVFMIWDRLFGTYVPETTTPRFGLTTPLETRNPVRIHLAGYASIRSLLSRATTLREKVLALFGPPEWKPES
jgi:sterol desaturase/sphingolipid hydroxylase (fatty acid hydroxylase superfamily)